MKKQSRSKAEKGSPAQKDGGPAPIGAREELCAALVRVAARHGLDGVTYRSVGAEAGLSHGAASYHFANREEMIREALAWASTHSIQLSHLSVDASLEELAADLPVLMSEHAEESMFSFELVLEASRRPDLVPEVRATYDEAIEAVRDSLARLGLGEDENLARLVFAAIDGLSVQHLIYQDTAATAEGVRTLQALLADRLKAQRPARRSSSKSARKPRKA